MRQKYYKSGDKADKLLANSLKQRELSSIISAVRSEEGESKAKTVDINSMFRDFYVNLHTAEIQRSEEDMERFFQGLDLPRLSESQKTDLDRPITSEEIIRVIKGLPTGKAPGPDGFTAEFFKCYVTELTPLLFTMYNGAFVKGELPATLSEALVTLVLKKEKDPCYCKNYRPISLIPLDAKILSKILAEKQ